MRKTAPSVRPSSRPGSEWDRSVYSLPCGAHQHQPSARTIRGRCAVGCHRAEPSSENVRRPAAVRSPGATLAYAEHWNGAVPCSSVQHTPVASSATAPACSPRTDGPVVSCSCAQGFAQRRRTGSGSLGRQHCLGSHHVCYNLEEDAGSVLHGLASPWKRRGPDTTTAREVFVALWVTG
jgi:hypothetical protein